MTTRSGVRIRSLAVLIVLLFVLASVGGAQRVSVPPPTTAYGAPITLDDAKAIMAEAETKAKQNHWTVAIAIVDSTGHLVLLERLDNTQFGSIRAAQDKAQSAVDFKRSTKVFEDLVAEGGIGMRTLALHGAYPLEGGIPLIRDDRIVGAIGVSGGSSIEDGQVAQAGVDALRRSGH